MSAVDAALVALKSAIEARLAAATFPVGWPGVPVVDFTDPAPDMVTEGGVVIVPPGTIAFENVALGPVFENRHRVAIQVYADHSDADMSNAARDVIVKEIAALTTENQTLSGAVEDLNAVTNDRDNMGAKGAELTSAAIVTLELVYLTNSPAA